MKIEICPECGFYSARHEVHGFGCRVPVTWLYSHRYAKGFKGEQLSFPEVIIDPKRTRSVPVLPKK